MSQPDQPAASAREGILEEGVLQVDEGKQYVQSEIWRSDACSYILPFDSRLPLDCMFHTSYLVTTMLTRPTIALVVEFEGILEKNVGVDVKVAVLDRSSPSAILKVNGGMPKNQASPFVQNMLHDMYVILFTSFSRLFSNISKLP